MVLATVVFVLTAIAFVKFNSAGERTDLVHIDSLLTNSQMDSAQIQLDRISLEGIRLQEDSAYYYLLRKEADYRQNGPNASDSTIDYCVDYYEKLSDKELLARAYYYKGVAQVGKTDVPQTILYLKKAEELADKTSNLILRHKIYESLSYYNNISYEKSLSLVYAKKTLEMAKLLGSKEREAIAWIYMASCYSDMGRNDSLGICVQECLPLIHYIKDVEKAYLYTRMGELYEKCEPELAKTYLKKAIDILPQSWTLLALSNIYVKENNNVEAEKVWDAAVEFKGGTKAKIAMLKAMRQQQTELGNVGRANELADSVLKLLQNYYETQERERIAEIQAKYDKETAVREQRGEFMKWGFVAVIVVLMIIGLLGYRTLLGEKADKELAEKRLLLEQALLESDELREENESNAEDRQRLQREIDQLQQRINELLADHTGILARGKQCHEAICQGGTTVLWTRDDFLNYMEYYKMQDLAFVNELRTLYDRLSPKYMFFAALEHQGKTDEEIMRIMGVGENTLRSTRSRIRSKRRKE